MCSTLSYHTNKMNEQKQTPFLLAAPSPLSSISPLLAATFLEIIDCPCSLVLPTPSTEPCVWGTKTGTWNYKNKRWKPTSTYFIPNFIIETVKSSYFNLWNGFISIILKVTFYVDFHMGMAVAPLLFWGTGPPKFLNQTYVFFSLGPADFQALSFQFCWDCFYPQILFIHTLSQVSPLISCYHPPRHFFFFAH